MTRTKKDSKQQFGWDQDSPFQYFQCSSPVLLQPIASPSFYQIDFSKSQNKKLDSSIWSSTNHYVGQNLKYTSNVTKAIYDIVVLSIKKYNPEDSTCGFY